MSYAHSKVRQTWFRLWALLALLFLTWSAGEWFISGTAAATLEAAQPVDAAHVVSAAPSTSLCGEAVPTANGFAHDSALATLVEGAGFAKLRGLLALRNVH